jgi:hypothetical protein
MFYAGLVAAGGMPVAGQWSVALPATALNPRPFPHEPVRHWVVCGSRHGSPAHHVTQSFTPADESRWFVCAGCNVIGAPQFERSENASSRCVDMYVSIFAR